MNSKTAGKKKAATLDNESNQTRSLSDIENAEAEQTDPDEAESEDFVSETDDVTKWVQEVSISAKCYVSLFSKFMILSYCSFPSGRLWLSKTWTRSTMTRSS